MQRRGAASTPFPFKMFKSVEFVRTDGTLVTTRTDTFLEGNSSSSFRMSRPCRGQTHSIKKDLRDDNILNRIHVSVHF